MTFPTIVDEVAFGTDPLETPTWTVLASTMPGGPQSFSIQTGRQAATDEVQPGTLSQTQDNSDRRYDPNHTSGPYYGNLKPRKRFRKRATYLGVTYDLYYGFVTGWPQTYSPPAVSHSNVNATDWFGFLGGITFQPSTWLATVNALAPSLWWRLNESLGSATVGDASGNGNTGTVVGGVTFEQPGGVLYEEDRAAKIAAYVAMSGGSDRLRLTSGSALISGTVDFSVAYLYKGPAFTANTTRSTFFQGVAATTGAPRWGLSMTGNGTWPATTAAPQFIVGATSATPALSAAYIDEDSWHLIVGTRDATTLAVYWDGTLVDTTAVAATSVTSDTLRAAWVFPGAPPDPVSMDMDEMLLWDGTALTAGQVTDLWAAAREPWSADTTGVRIDRVLDSIGVSAGDRNISAGLSELGAVQPGGDVLSYIRTLARTEGGPLYVDHADGGKIRFRDREEMLTATRSTVVQATFTDDPAATPPAYRFEPDGLELLYDEQLVYNQVSVSWEGGTAVASDATSIAEYGLRTYSIDTVGVDATEAFDYADFVLDRYKDVKTRLPSLTIRPSANPDLWVPALSLQLGDLVAFRLLPQNVGSAIEFELIVEGIDHNVSGGVSQWETTFYLSPAP